MKFQMLYWNLLKVGQTQYKKGRKPPFSLWLARVPVKNLTKKFSKTS